MGKNARTVRMSHESEGKKPRTKLVGNRIPRTFFITKGKGQSDYAVHAGSYHLALHDAGIERCNIMQYSSILPKIADEVEKTEETIDSLVHGSVMDTIMANATAEKGKRATAGMIFGWLYDKKTNQKYGGIVCEYNGELTEEQCREMLQKNIQELYENGYSEKFHLEKGKIITETIVPEKNHGTALVALCFLDYEVPVIE